MSVDSECVQRALALMKAELEGYDGSHDFHHVLRVLENAEQLCNREGIIHPSCVEVVQLAAILHDYGDSKYYDREDLALTWLLNEGHPEAHLIYNIIQNVSYSKNEKNGRKEPLSILHAIVQDADRLDAIGHIGIMRAFSYGKGTLRDVLGHMREKIYTIESLLKTDGGRDMAKGKTQIVIDFCTECIGSLNSYSRAT